MKRIPPASGFTLIEMLVTVAVLGAVSAMVVVLVCGAQRGGEVQAIRAELREIREACVRFNADMGEMPRYLAELMQSPDNSDSLGGWWWRTDGTPPARLMSFDPTVGRGWNGPYIHPELLSEGTEEASESRTNESGDAESKQSVNAAGHRLALLSSEYACHPQEKDGDVTHSHFQLDFSDSREIAVRFLHDPLEPATEANVIARLGLGVKP